MCAGADSQACRNFAPHLRGNVYVQYETEEQAAECLRRMNARWSAVRGPVNVCLPSVDVASLLSVHTSLPPALTAQVCWPQACMRVDCGAVLARGALRPAR
jgi:hypothetical protein